VSARDAAIAPLLFAYGTFLDPWWRPAILGEDYPVRRAVLPGWRRCALDNGYLTIAPCEGGVVNGLLVELDPIGWRVADAWEEVPKYVRTPVVARTAEGRVDALAYVAGDGLVAAPVPETWLALITAREVESSIAIFARTMRRVRAGGGA